MRVENLTEHAFAAYGRVFSGPFPGKDPTSAFSFPKSDFWQANTFDPGLNGQSEILWVNYRDTTLDLVQHLSKGTPATETSIVSIEPI